MAVKPLCTRGQSTNQAATLWISWVGWTTASSSSASSVPWNKAHLPPPHFQYPLRTRYQICQDNDLFPIAVSHLFFLFFLKILFIYLERREGKEKERERNINVWLPLMRPQLGTWPTTQACALTGNRTSNPSVHRPTLNPLSYTSQDIILFFLISKSSASDLAFQHKKFSV